MPNVLSLLIFMSIFASYSEALMRQTPKNERIPSLKYLHAKWMTGNTAYVTTDPLKNNFSKIWWWNRIHGACTLRAMKYQQCGIGGVISEHKYRHLLFWNLPDLRIPQCCPILVCLFTLNKLKHIIKTSRTYMLL